MFQTPNTQKKIHEAPIRFVMPQTEKVSINKGNKEFAEKVGINKHTQNKVDKLLEFNFIDNYFYKISFIQKLGTKNIIKEG